MTDKEEGFQKLNYPIAQFFMGTNQIVLGGGLDGSGFKTTISSVAPAANRVATIPALAANDSFVFLAQAQTLTNKTLTSPIIDRITSNGAGLPIFFPDASYGSQSYFNIQQKAFDSPYDSIVTFAVAAPGNNNINPTRASMYVGTLDDVAGSSVQFLVGSPLANFGFLEFFLNSNNSGRGKLSVYNSSQSEVEVMNFDSSIINFLKPISTDNIKPSGQDLNIRFPDASYGARSYFNIQQKAVSSPYDSIITFAMGTYGNNNTNATEATLYIGTLDDVSGTSTRILCGGPETNFGILQFYINANTSTRGRLAVFNSSQSEVDVMTFDSTIITLAKNALGNGSILSNSPSAGLGYAAGAGGTVTQATSKTTGVTLNKICGQITTASDLLGAAASATFTLTNSTIAATDLVDVQVASGASTVGSYQVECSSRASGSCTITIRNTLALTGLSEALVLTFAVKKVVIS